MWSQLILSAQCTDARVNLVTPKVFAAYPTAADYAGADRAELETLIQSTGFFRAKTNSLIGLGQALVERYHGEVPARLKVLVTLPGVGRKTANVVLGNAFGKPKRPAGGRRVCHSRRPACGACPVAALCPSFGEGEIDQAKAAKLVKTPDQVAAAT